MVVLHPEMGRLWVWAWACLLVAGFAREARADAPGFLPVRVCVRPPEVPATVWGWGYPSGGPVLPLLRRKPWTRERFLETSYPFPIYLFDPDAPAAHTKQLPIPYRKLPCDPKPPAENKEVTEPLAPSPPAAPKAETKKEAPKPTPPPFVSPNKEPEPRPRPPPGGATSGWTKMVLPIVCHSASRVKVLPTTTVLPMNGRTAEDKIDPVRSTDRAGRCDERFVAAPAPGMKKPAPPPPGGKNYAASKAIEQARQAARDADRIGAEVGGKFGKALGDAQEALKTLHRLTAGALPRILKSNPKFVDELQSGLGEKLNAIPELPTYADPKLAEIARKGFERGLGYGLADAKLKATAVGLAAEAALALSGSAAIVAERAGATALKGALARLKRMPVFIPGAIDGGGAFFRLPKPQSAQAARGGAAVGKVHGVSRLHPDEIATGERLSKQLGIPLRESPHAGAEFVDDLGRTYDALGRPAASKFWNPQAFFKSIDAHLLKSNDFTVVDLTGFTAAQKAAVKAYVDGLAAASQGRIVRIGF